MINCICVEHMTKSFDSFQLEDIHFSMKPGYVLGLIGRNGAGKTTLLNTIIGLWAPEKGRILIGDYDRAEEPVPSKEIIAFVTDECILPKGMTPNTAGKLFRSMYTGFHYEHYKRLCRRFSLPMHKTVKRMSKGMVIKLQIALAFSREAKLYVFDEPSAGLDPVFRKEFIDIIFDLIQDQTKSVIFSTHLTDELDRIADNILFLEGGKQLLFEQKEELISRYRLLRGPRDRIEEFHEYILGRRFTENSCEALVTTTGCSSAVEGNPLPGTSQGELQISIPTIEDIMYYLLKGKRDKYAV
ncbi:ABC-2 type transport system ATP-binding protein [Anaerotaenia torta]|uniref:ABC transporter ATP-binding protein n=1 Tax=Anaerotaenia torta TaxID=433293 RepID=UPI003D1D86AC